MFLFFNLKLSGFNAVQENLTSECIWIVFLSVQCSFPLINLYYDPVSSKCIMQYYLLKLIKNFRSQSVCADSRGYSLLFKKNLKFFFFFFPTTMSHLLISTLDPPAQLHCVKKKKQINSKIIQCKLARLVAL